ncbi:MAG TPA: metalloprotease TldD [Geminicoccaceae bacterium]|nr:metalloprotease TldD [Geminicoccus sp.]HMU49592.1 metalloprotease TldD [Geminicoccaceae bacterium]
MEPLSGAAGSREPGLIEALGLDPRRAADIVGEALMPMDDGELFVERRSGETLAFDDGRLRTASRDASRGFGLRAVSGERVGLACSAGIDEPALRRAAATVAAVARGHAGRDNAPLPAPGPLLYRGEDPLGGEPQAGRIALLQEIDAYCRASGDDVRQVSVGILSGHQEIEVLRGDGSRVGDSRPLVRLNVQVVVERAGRRESGGHGGGGRFPLSVMLAGAGWRAIADEALRQARLKLDAIPAPAGEMTVVLGPGWPGVMLHEAVGHGLEGDFNRKGTSAFAGLMGQQVAARGVTVVDDGTLPGRRGSLNIDDEGTPSGRTVLIEDGILKGYMQDRQNARLMRAAPTGNGRRQSYAHTVMPRMTNTCMLAGDRDPAEILAGVERGLYAVNFGGGQVDITSGRFVFTASEAYLIENGRVTAPVKGATLIGNGPEAMRRITAVGDDLRLDSGVGTCGKNGQGVPVGVGQPTLRMERMTVGGTRRGG